MRPDFAIQRTCSGVVPQQPPTMRGAEPGSCGARTRRSTPASPCRAGGRRRCGAGPALGCTQSGRPAPRMRSAMASASCGPSPQLTPMASAPQSRSVVATCSGVDPSATVSLGVEGHRGDDRQAGRRAPGRFDGDPDLLEVAEGLEHEEIDAALGERRGLLGEGRGHLVELGPGRDAGDQAGRADRAGHPRVLAGRLAREPGAGEVVGAHLVAQPVAVEAEAVGAEGVGLDDLRAGGDVVLVDLAARRRAG